MVRIVLADDHNVVRAGFKTLLEAEPGFEIVGEAADGEQAYALVEREKPDILLLDISMPPGQSGLIACERIVQNHPMTRVIILTMFEEPEYLFYTLRGGASGYLLKSASSEELIVAINAVCEGGVYIHSKMTASLTRQLFIGDEEESASTFQLLTNRELEILQLLAKGYTNKEVAEKVYLSTKTIEVHRGKIYQKLGIETRAELVAYALKHKLLDQ